MSCRDGHLVKANRSIKGLLLFPGAGTSASHASLVHLDKALAPLPVRRADFPYRLAGRKAPDRPPVLLDPVRREAADFATSLKTKSAKIVLGGRSMGGRMCSMAVAGGPEIDEPVAAAGLVLMSYPLHPPGRPDKLRVEHLPRLEVPCLFVQGTRDAFGAPTELERWTATIPGPVTHVWLDGKGHDLKGADSAIAAAVEQWLRALA